MKDFQDHQIRDVIKINYMYTLGGQSKFFIEFYDDNHCLEIQVISKFLLLFYCLSFKSPDLFICQSKCL